MPPKRPAGNTFYLVRHAAHELVDQVLAGRTPGVNLSPLGRKQAKAIAHWLAPLEITHILSSPQPRALQTAAPLARKTGLLVIGAAALDEMNFGEWTGRSFAELKLDPHWQSWNRTRAAVRPPGGETMAEAQARVIHALNTLNATHTNARFALFSHAEIIRAVVLRCLSLPLDAWNTLEIAPASMTALEAPAGCAPAIRLRVPVAA